jgi:hypothetical protein
MALLDRLGEHLLGVVAEARREVVLCAPFAKTGVIARVLTSMDASASLKVITRWRPEEVAAGVSDTGILALVEQRGGSVLLCDRLHAKYVRSDDRVLIGSANLTATALGWTSAPNLELLVEVLSDTPEVLELEQVLGREAIPATAELAHEVARAAALLPQTQPELETVAESDRVASAATWYPRLREPGDLFLAYSTGADRLSRASAAAATHDLAALQLPAGLQQPAFLALVESRLLQSPVVQALDDVLLEPRRFGFVRDTLAERLDLARDEADFAWQTLMRWLLEFLPQRYERRVTNWSEVVVRRGDGVGRG